MMISILVCSINDLLFEKLQANIKKTIGVQFEIILYKNTLNLGICEVYNILINQAKGDYLCFVHEDVLFHTQNWGKEVVRILSDKKIGLLGVAGGTYQSAIPNSWYTTDLNTNAHLLQRQNEQPFLVKKGFHGDDTEQPVVCIDGVFMCCRKETAETTLFNSENKGFHAYDIDFSMRIIEKGLSVVCTNQILIEHFSQGTTNDKWFQSVCVFAKEWQHRLPLKVSGSGYTKEPDEKLENKLYEKLYNFLFRYKIKKLEGIKMLIFFGRRQSLLVKTRMIYGLIRK